jgi:hypothetical protein
MKHENPHVCEESEFLLVFIIRIVTSQQYERSKIIAKQARKRSLKWMDNNVKNFALKTPHAFAFLVPW